MTTVFKWFLLVILSSLVQHFVERWGCLPFDRTFLDKPPASHSKHSEKKQNPVAIITGFCLFDHQAGVLTFRQFVIQPLFKLFNGELLSAQLNGVPNNLNLVNRRFLRFEAIDDFACQNNF